MKRVFIITQNKKRFEDLYCFLFNHDYFCEQSWEEMEANINMFRALDVKWPLPSRNCQILESMTEDSFEKVKEMLVGKNFNNNKKFPDLFIIDDCPCPSINLESEKFFACIQYVSYSLNGPKAKCSVIFLIHEVRTEEVALHSENNYVLLRYGNLTHFELIKSEVKKAIDEFIERTNPKTLMGWLIKNF